MSLTPVHIEVTILWCFLVWHSLNMLNECIITLRALQLAFSNKGSVYLIFCLLSPNEAQTLSHLTLDSPSLFYPSTLLPHLSLTIHLVSEYPLCMLPGLLIFLLILPLLSKIEIEWSITGEDVFLVTCLYYMLMLILTL